MGALLRRAGRKKGLSGAVRRGQPSVFIGPGSPQVKAGSRGPERLGNGGEERIRTSVKAFALKRFSKPPPSATRPPLRDEAKSRRLSDRSPSRQGRQARQPIPRYTGACVF